MIGDTVRDVEAAKENNVISFAVASGKSSQEELSQSDPDLLLPDLRDTEEILRAILDQ
jgi:phosphoglycolate phosphatase-like HAD superfamily hydrolase